MRLVCCGVLALFLVAPARAEITADAVARYEAAGAEVIYGFLSATLSGDVPTLQNPRYAPALRVLGDSSIFIVPLTESDLDALLRISQVAGDIYDRYSKSTAAGGASPPPSRAKLLAMSEVAGLLLAFTMHTAAASADIITNTVVANSAKLPKERLTALSDAAHTVMLRAIRTAAAFGSAPLSADLRRSVLAALDVTMPRMARTLPPAKRAEAQALLSAAAEKAEDQQTLIAGILTRLRDAPCNPLCQSR